MSNTERPTDRTPPPSSPGTVSVVIPRAAALPGYGPNPDSYLEQSVAQILAGMSRLDESERAVRSMLDVAVRRIGVEADERMAAAVKQLEASITLTNGEVRRCREEIERAREDLSVLRGRVGAVETNQETSTDRLERMELDMAAFREQIEQRIALMSAEIASIKQTAAP